MEVLHKYFRGYFGREWGLTPCRAFRNNSKKHIQIINNQIVNIKNLTNHFKQVRNIANSRIYVRKGFVV